MKLRFIPVMLMVGLLLALGGPLLAQETTETPDETNGVWVRGTTGPASIAGPGDWSMTQLSEGDPVVFEGPNGAQLNLNVIDNGRPLTIEEISADVEGTVQAGAELLDSALVDLPATPAVRTEQLIPTGDLNVRLVQYLIPADTYFVVVTGAVADSDDPEFIADVIRIIDSAANTLQLDVEGDMPWDSFTTGDNALRVQVPDGWDLLDPSGDNNLGFRHQDDPAVFIVTHILLTPPVSPLEDFAESMADSYLERGGEVLEQGIISQPVGDSLRLYGASQLELTDGSMLPRQEWQFYVLRGPYLILITASTRDDLFEAYAPIFQRMVDTIAFEPEPVE
jgi:hypothetical protein